jgi:HNH endonuclease
MRYWWVNQNRTYAEEFAGGYLWSPKRKQNDARNRFYENMREVSPGDIVFSFRNTLIAALGRITSYGYEALRPSEFGEKGTSWARVGWKVDVDYREVPRRVHPKSHIASIRGLLPDKYSPLRKETGDGLQSVYLAEVGRELAAYLLALTLDAGAEPPPKSGAPATQEEDASARDIEEQHQLQFDGMELPETTRLQLVKARVGQGKFRDRLRQHESMCRLTGVSDPAYLIASHTWPWRHADPYECLDGENGFLLTPNADRLFDRGWISFADDGEVLISPLANLNALGRLGVEPPLKVLGAPFTPKQKHYLAKHRREIFKRINE